MPRRSPLRFIVCTLIVLAAHGVCGQAFGLPVPFTGDSLPAPPQQNAPWQPPDTPLDADLVDATRRLFELGMADPRGCEYRDIAVVVGDVRTGMGYVKSTRGWVLPAEGDGTARFAVCWNGLVYPVLSVGGSADFRSDAREAIHKWREQMDERIRVYREYHEDPDIPVESIVRESRKAWPERDFVGTEALTSLRAALLLRLGEGDLAKEYWELWCSGHDVDEFADGTAYGPWGVLAADWAWSLLDRTVCAYRRYDDSLALLGARKLIELRGELGEELAGYDQAPVLVRELERRRAEADRPRALEMGLDWYPDRQARIAALIHDLEDASGTIDYSETRRILFSEDPIVQALIVQGKAALEPLIECRDTDTRLTRAVCYEIVGPYRYFHGVPEAAHAAIVGILARQPSFPAYARDSKEEMDAAARRLLQAGEDEPALAHWYRVLADGSAEPKDWAEAAEALTGPADPLSYGMRYLPTIEPSDDGGPLWAEPLRGTRTPGISQLMATRALDGSTPPVEACRIAMNLYYWDRPTALPVLTELSHRLMGEFQSRKVGPGAEQREGLPQGTRGDAPGRSDVTRGEAAEELNRVLHALDHAGDISARGDFVRLLRVAPPHAFADRFFSWPQAEALTMLWLHPEDPELGAAADWLLTDEKSPILELARASEEPEWLRIAELAATPMIRTPALRRRLLDDLLLDQAEVAPAEFGNASFTYGLPSQTVRVCDAAGRALGQHIGFPALDLEASEDERDATLARARLLLERYGARIEYTPEAWRSATRLMLEPLESPAEQEDVEAGRAVFSLEGKGRLVEGVELPQRAVWLDPDFTPPDTSRLYPPVPSPAEARPRGRPGWVFQAEELAAKPGECYYGFVGADDIRRIPADQVELMPHSGDTPWWPLWWPGTGRWREVSPSLSALMGHPGAIEPDANTWVSRIDEGDDTTVAIWLHNRSGRPVEVPDVLYRKADGGLPAVVGGLSIGLEHCPGAASMRTPPDAWRPVAARGTEPLPMAGTRRLAPGQTWQAAAVDLRDMFDMSRPGAYRLRVHFDGPGALKGDAADVLFTLRPPYPGGPEFTPPE